MPEFASHWQEGMEKLGTVQVAAAESRPGLDLLRLLELQRQTTTVPNLSMVPKSADNYTPARSLRM